MFLHPLSHIPGPKLAAATYILEFYHDVIRIGRYTKRIEQMHEEYGIKNSHYNLRFQVMKEYQGSHVIGPIVRISPNEVHCADGHFIEEIYASGNRARDKPIHQVRGTGL